MVDDNERPELSEQAIHAAELAEKRHHAWISLLRTDFGAIVLAELREMCGVQQSPHVPGDPYWTHVRIGTADVWRMVLARMRLTDEDFTDQLWVRYLKEKK
jgi:hypothetical protein